MTPVKVKNVYDFLGTGALFGMRGWVNVDTVEESDIVCLNGGADIATEIYNEISHFRGVPEKISPRDRMEMTMYKVALEQGKFILGICRGAQLANCLNGGKLYQHVNNHQMGHTMFDLKTRSKIFTTSVHHQAMEPGPGADIIAVASQSTMKVSAKGKVINLDDTFKKELSDGEDIEVLWYPKSRSLCIQGHPEFSPHSPFADYCFELIESLRVDNVWPAKKTASVAAG